VKSPSLVRCPWASNALSIRYHDEEWGVPVHDDRKLFEFLVLEGAQAGLSWDTVLKKREHYRAAFDAFEVKKIAGYDRRKLASLLKNEGIIRNRLKIASAVQNAKAFLKIQSEFGSFDRYLWSFAPPDRGQARKLRSQVPASTPVSDQLSKDLKKRGFTFVGTTICYAFMQAVGIVNDHLVTCYRYSAIAGAKTPAASRPRAGSPKKKTSLPRV
jgi:DNA-3-methyladenine glycosylase I